MNNFANSLLHLLLRWMRTLFGSLLNLLQGDDSGMLAWVSRHWIPLAALLLIAGLVLDAVIYMARWRPQYVWRTRMRRMFNREQESEEELQFNQGFDTSLPDFNFADTPISDLATNEAISEETLETYLAEPAPAPEESFDYSQLPGAEASSEERRRRSDRHSRRFGNHARSRLRGLRGNGRRRVREEINPRDAFHEAVYPSAEPPIDYQEDESFHHV